MSYMVVDIEMVVGFPVEPQRSGAAGCDVLTERAPIRFFCAQGGENFLQEFTLVDSLGVVEQVQTANVHRGLAFLHHQEAGVGEVHWAHTIYLLL